jgi:hypothetical protein
VLGDLVSRLALLVFAILPAGCAGACASAPLAAKLILPEPKAPDMTGILRLQGRFASAHACPIGPELALTSAHVGDMRPFDKDVALLPFRWSDGDGHGGVLDPVAVSMAEDLAAYKPREGQFARYYAVASAPPEPGTRLWLLGFDWRNGRDAFAPRVLEATVVRVVAGTVVLNKTAWRGASGSCVLNAEGEVVGIVRSLHEMENGQAVTAAVGVWK